MSLILYLTNKNTNKSKSLSPSLALLPIFSGYPQ